MEREEKVLREEIYETKCPKEITIGDEWYLKDLDKDGAKAHRNLDNLTLYKYKPRCCKVCKVAVRELEVPFGDDADETFTCIEVQISSASSEEKVDVYLTGRHYKDTLKKQNELACDTASFSIYTTFGSEEFNTLADGFYGSVMRFKEYYGYSIYLSLDTDAYSFEEMLSKIQVVFPRTK